jgi:hypothetical protein
VVAGVLAIAGTVGAGVPGAVARGAHPEAHFVWHGVGGNYIPLVGDFDGDHHSDVFWYAPGKAGDSIWYGRTDRHFTVINLQVLGSYRPVVLDFNGDGRSDILWYGPGSQADSVWLGNANHTFTVRRFSMGGNYLPVAGDFNGDGHDDILWYAPGTAHDSMWLGKGNGQFTSHALTINGEYRLAVGDYNGDGRDDVFFTSVVPNEPNYLDLAAANGTLVGHVIAGAITHSLTFAVDANHDRRDDIFVYQPGHGADWVWYSGASGLPASKRVTSVDGIYRPVAGDFDGDGHDDIFWYGPGPLPDHVWFDVAHQLPPPP